MPHGDVNACQRHSGLDLLVAAALTIGPYFARPVNSWTF